MSADLTNTLFISFDGICDPLGQSQILPYLTGISQNGYNITILSCEKKSRWEKEHPGVESLLKKHGIDWHFIYYDEDGGFLSRWKYVQQIKELAIQLTEQKKMSLTHCRSYLSALTGLFLKRNKNIPFLFDMRGFWADERIDGGIWTLKNPLHFLAYNYFKYYEKRFLKESAAIVSLTENAKRDLMKRFPGFNLEQKVSIIPCCADTELFDPLTTQTSNQFHFDSKDHVIIYTGSIGTWYYTRELLDCMNVWKRSLPNLKLLMVTRDREALQAILDTYPDETRNFVSISSASYNEMPSILKVAQASAFFIQPSFSKIASSPTKMAESWSMNLPIITNPGIGDNDIYFKNNRGGILVQEFTETGYQKACEAYLQLKRDGYREIAIERFDKKMAVKIYSSIYSVSIKRS